MSSPVQRYRSCVRAASIALALLAAALLARPAAAEEALPKVLLDTSMGDIVVELFTDRAPVTAANFLELVEQDFYDGLVFHRVVAGFVIQAGGYDAGMNYREPPGGNIVNESSNGLANARGTLAMARLSDPDSANTQFFINVADNTHLDARPGQPGYAVFGRVIDGMDVVTEIELSNTTRKAGMAGVPEEPIVIESAEQL